MKRALAAAAIGALILTGCSGGSGSYYDTICVDPITQIRLPDSNCYANPAWLYYVPYGYIAPGYGSHITNYNIHNYSKPSGATIHSGGVPTGGGKASKFKSGNVTVPKPKAPKVNQPKVNLNKPKPPAPKVGGKR